MTATCHEIRPLLDAYLDGELDIPATLAVTAHLETCPHCAAIVRRAGTLSGALRSRAPYHRAPNRLLEGLPGHDRTAAAAPRPIANWPVRWGLPLAASLALAIGLGQMQAARIDRQVLLDDVVSSHIRSLQAAHLDDIASSDHHTVKPWFAQKLDYSPPVLDLAAAGYPLAGGRLDYLDGRPVAALDYRHGQHVINVYVWPTRTSSACEGENQERSGFHAVRWCGGGMNWWAVSDMNARDLATFATLLQRAGEPDERKAS